jgi:RNA polymerase sigma factor (sigma-70 family)
VNRERATATSDLSRIAHDPDAFEAFYRAHITAVLGFVARRVDEPYLVADLAADVFLAAIDSAPTYRPNQGAPVGWLFGIARNVLAAERRRSARERRAVARIPAAAELVEADDLARLHARIDAEADSRRLYGAMKRLGDGERAVLELVALEGLSVREAANVLDVSPVTARVRLHRARGRLQAELAADAVPNTAQLTTEAPR